MEKNKKIAIITFLLLIIATLIYFMLSFSKIFWENPQTTPPVSIKKVDNQKGILSSGEIKSTSKYGTKTAYVLEKWNKSFLIINDERVSETVLNDGYVFDIESISGPKNIKRYDGIKFSPKGGYLLAKTSGWEWSGNEIYDAKNWREISGEDINNAISGYGEFGFTNDEKYFYACTVDGLASWYGGYVFSVPDFKPLYNIRKDSSLKDYLIDQETDVSCKEEDGKIKFVVKTSDSNWKDSKLPEKVVYFQLK